MKSPRIYPKQLTINITAADIKEGVERDPNHCVVACALKRQHPDFQHIAVDAATIRYTRTQKDGTRLRSIHITPPQLQKIVIATDQGLKKHLKPVTAVALPGMLTIKPARGRPRKGSQKKRKAIAKLAKNPKLVKANGGNNVPIVVGGKEPPKLSQRRGFGLRAMSL